MEPKFQGQHMDSAPPLVIINEEEEYKSTGHEDGERNTWCIGRVMKTNMING